MTSSLSDKQMRELKKAFDDVDVDKNGYIDISELRQFCRILLEQQGGAVTDNKVDDLVKQTMKKLDTSGDGKISFDEFVVSYRAHGPSV